MYRMISILAIPFAKNMYMWQGPDTGAVKQATPTSGKSMVKECWTNYNNIIQILLQVCTDLGASNNWTGATSGPGGRIWPFL